MQWHLYMNKRMNRGTGCGHLIQRFRLGCGERPCAGEVDQKDIVLP